MLKFKFQFEDGAKVFFTPQSEKKKKMETVEFSEKAVKSAF